MKKVLTDFMKEFPGMKCDEEFKYGPSEEDEKGKAIYLTEDVARERGQRFQKMFPTQGEQRPYECPHYRGTEWAHWHLTTKPKEVRPTPITLPSETVYRAPQKLPSDTKYKRGALSHIDYRRLLELQENGRTAGEIAQELQRTPDYVRRIMNGELPAHWKETPKDNNSFAAVPSSDPTELEQEAQRLTAEAEKLRKKAQLLRDAKSLKVEPWSGTGVILKKDGNSLPLTHVEIQELNEKLMNYMTSEGQPW